MFHLEKFKILAFTSVAHQMLVPTMLTGTSWLWVVDLLVLTGYKTIHFAYCLAYIVILKCIRNSECHPVCTSILSPIPLGKTVSFPLEG